MNVPFLTSQAEWSLRTANITSVYIQPPLRRERQQLTHNTHLPVATCQPKGRPGAQPVARTHIHLLVPLKSQKQSDDRNMATGTRAPQSIPAHDVHIHIPPPLVRKQGCHNICVAMLARFSKSGLRAIFVFGMYVHLPVAFKGKQGEDDRYASGCACSPKCSLGPTNRRCMHIHSTAALQG